MSVELNANIEEDGIGGWCIRLSDTLEDDEIVCSNLDVFSAEVEKMGGKYAGDINVTWSKDDNLTQDHFAQVHMEMGRIQQELNEKESQ